MCISNYILVTNKLKITKLVYQALIKEGKLVGLQNLPKVIPDPILPNLDRVSSLREEKKNKNKEMSEAMKVEEAQRVALNKEIQRQKIEKEDAAIEKIDQGSVIIEYNEGERQYPSRDGQKYVLCIDTNGLLMFLSEDLAYHSNIYSKYCNDWNCLWWWWLNMDKESKIIRLFWYSEWYGSVNKKFYKSIETLLNKQYPDYKINVQ